MRIFRPGQVADRADLGVEPAAHLTAGVAGRELDGVEAVGVHALQQLQPAALVEPGVLLAGVEPERQRRAERRQLGEAGVVVARRVADRVGAGLDVLQHLQRRHQLAARARRDAEAVAGQGGDRLGEHDRAAVDGVEVGRPAGRHLPLDLRQLGIAGDLDDDVAVAGRRRAGGRRRRRRCRPPPASSSSALPEQAASPRPAAAAPPRCRKSRRSIGSPSHGLRHPPAAKLADRRVPSWR